MTNVTIYENHNISTDATFRNICSKISDGLAAVGLVKMSDTGTVDWSSESVTAPTTNTYPRSEMWRFNDELNTTTPIFIKISYGRSNGQTLSLLITLGSGTNGSLTLTGYEPTMIGAFGLNYTNNASYNDSAQRYTLISGDTSGFHLCLSMDGGGLGGTYPNRGTIVVDRFRNGDGSPSPNGFFINHKNLGGYVGCYTSDRVSNQGYSQPTNPNVLFPTVVQSGYSQRQRDGSIPVGVHYGLIPSVGIYRSKMVVSVPKSDLAGLEQFNVNHLGSSRTFLSHGVFDWYWDSAQSEEVTSAQWWSD